MDQDSNPKQQQHAVLISSPGLGHLIPFLELANRMTSTFHVVNDHSFKATILQVSTRPSSSSSSSSNPNTLTDFFEIPPADISTIIEPEADVVWRLGVLMRETRPAIRAAIEGLEPKPTTLIFDMFATESLPIARDLGLPAYVYLTSGAWFLALTLMCPFLDEEIQGEYVDQPEPLKIPGCKPVRPVDVVDPMLIRGAPQYGEYLRMGREIPKFDGVLVNTWQDLEPVSLAAFRSSSLSLDREGGGGDDYNDHDDGAIIREKILHVPVYAIGPLTTKANYKPARASTTTTTNNNNTLAGEGNHDPNYYKKLFEWLDRQPIQSVLYVSFGSAGSLSTEQMAELAWGLEMSQQRFVWVVRPPIDFYGEKQGIVTSYFGWKATDDPNQLEDTTPTYLPPGFIGRIQLRGTGFLIKQWAPQSEILEHPAVGGFLSHCGWNSILESVTNGVPMIAWPLYAEQRMNATMLVEELRIATRPKEVPTTNKVVKRDEIQRMVRLLLNEEEELTTSTTSTTMRAKAKDLQASARKALSQAQGSCGGGGSSFNDLSRFLKRCCNLQQTHHL